VGEGRERDSQPLARASHVGADDGNRTRMFSLGTNLTRARSRRLALHARVAHDPAIGVTDRGCSPARARRGHAKKKINGWSSTTVDRLGFSRICGISPSDTNQTESLVVDGLDVDGDLVVQGAVPSRPLEDLMYIGHVGEAP